MSSIGASTNRLELVRMIPAVRSPGSEGLTAGPGADVAIAAVGEHLQEETAKGGLLGLASFGVLYRSGSKTERGHAPAP